MTVRDIDAFLTYLSSQLPSGATLSASALRVAIGDCLDTIRDRMFEYKGEFNPSTTTLVDGSGRKGDVYRASAAGARDFGAGSLTFAVGDWVWYDGAVWGKGGGSGTGTYTPPVTRATGTVLSVNSEHVLEDEGTYTIATGAENDLLVVYLPAATDVTITGIGDIENTTTDVSVFAYIRKGGAWVAIKGASGSGVIYTAATKTARDLLPLITGEQVYVESNRTYYVKTASGFRQTSKSIYVDDVGQFASLTTAEIENETIAVQHYAGGRRQQWHTSDSGFWSQLDQSADSITQLLTQYATSLRFAGVLEGFLSTHTGPVLQVKRANDSAVRSFTPYEWIAGDVHKWATVSALGGSLLTNAYVERWYDYAGNYVEQTGADSLKPYLVQSGVEIRNPDNGRRAIKFESGRYLTRTLTAPGADLTMASVSKATLNNDFHTIFGCGTSSNVDFRHTYNSTRGVTTYYKGDSANASYVGDDLDTNLKTRIMASHLNPGSSPEVAAHGSTLDTIGGDYAAIGTVHANGNTSAGGTLLTVGASYNGTVTLTGYVQAAIAWDTSYRTLLADICAKLKAVYQ